MRPVPNDIVSTLIRYLPQILENVQIDSGNTRLINSDGNSILMLPN